MYGDLKIATAENGFMFGLLKSADGRLIVCSKRLSGNAKNAEVTSSEVLDQQGNSLLIGDDESMTTITAERTVMREGARLVVVDIIGTSYRLTGGKHHRVRVQIKKGDLRGSAPKTVFDHELEWEPVQ